MKVGILGGGQLGRMLGQAGLPLGIQCIAVDPTGDAPARAYCEHIRADYNDHAAIARLGLCDAVTIEFENVPQDALHQAAQLTYAAPPAKALAVSADRFLEKSHFAALGVPTAPFRSVNCLADLEAALRELSPPCIIKTRRFGYDGKGQARISSSAEASAAWLEVLERPAIVEQVVDFKRELSIIAVRARGGDCKFYPLVENTHRKGILDLSVAPAPELTQQLQDQAENIAKQLLLSLDYVGVLTLELFETNEGLVVNEMAPRVHNSGHWTIEGSVTSQFENHLRAVLNLPLGDTRAVGASAMVNIIGEMPRTEDVLATPGAHLHSYDKAPRAGRKIGHVTITAENHAELLLRLSDLSWR